MIYYYIVHIWLCKLRFVNKEVYKDIFINTHKQLDIIEDQNCFLTKIEKLKLYIVKFNKNNGIKIKNYLVNCVVKDKKYCLIIIITYDKYIFSINDRVQKT